MVDPCSHVHFLSIELEYNNYNTYGNDEIYFKDSLKNGEGCVSILCPRVKKLLIFVGPLHPGHTDSHRSLHPNLLQIE